MILTKRSILRLLAVVVLAVFVVSCGDTFRPTINFKPQPSGNPAALGNAVVLSTNPAGNGSDTHIDVSGDSNAGIITVGPNPIFLGKGGGRAIVINSDNTLTLYSALVATSTVVTTVTLPASVSGPIGIGTSSNSNVYIANSGSNDVSVIPAGQTFVTALVPVGTTPVMVAASSGGNKIYVVNNGSNNVSVVGTADNIFVKNIAVGAQPVWGVMSDDGNDVFIVNQGDGTVSVIDTALDQVITTIPVGASPNFAFYDTVRKRVYVSNTGSNTISIIKADSIDLAHGVLPVKLADVTVSGPPISVAAIADGTRAYAALGGCPSGTNHVNLMTTSLGGPKLASCTGNQVSVIDAIGLVQSKVITLGSGVVSIAAATDGTRVYAVNSHDGTISIIRTSTDSEVLRMMAPAQSLSCTNPAICPATAQTPFQVLTFP